MPDMDLDLLVDMDMDLDGAVITNMDVSSGALITMEIDGESGGTSDYNRLTNKPKIEGVTLKGDKTFKQLGIDTITEQDIDKMIFG